MISHEIVALDSYKEVLLADSSVVYRPNILGVTCTHVQVWITINNS